jgi:hypothetical protein
MMLRLRLLSLVVLLAAGLSAQSARWQVRKMAELDQFWVPECALPVPGSDRVFVSNVAAAKGEYWTDDGKGFLSVLVGGRMQRLRWLQSKPGAVLDGPKGMCLFRGKLYFTDNTRLLRCNPDDGSGLEVVAEGFGKANDLATDGDAVWLSDGQESKIWRIAEDGAKREIVAPKGVNGITFAQGRMFAVSWELHDVYEVFPIGAKDPRPFRLADHFTNLDGIEVLADGTFIVSDFMGNKVCAITPDGKTVYTLVQLESPADIGIDRQGMILYIPQFFTDKVVLFRLSF